MEPNTDAPLVAGGGLESCGGAEETRFAAESFGCMHRVFQKVQIALAVAVVPHEAMICLLI